MTREELIAELDEAAAQFAAQIAATASESTGVPKPPSIEVTESQLEPSRFSVDLTHDPRSEVEEVPGGGGGPPPPGGGPPPPPTGCGVMGSFQCDSIAASKSKCGFNFIGNRRFLQRDRTWNFSHDCPPCICDPAPHPPCIYGGASGSGTGSRSDGFDPVTCTEFCNSVGGSCTIDQGTHDTGGCPPGADCTGSGTPVCDRLTLPSCGAGIMSGVAAVSDSGWIASTLAPWCDAVLMYCIFTYMSVSTSDTETTRSQVYYYGAAGCNQFYGYATSILSNEYTTEMLKGQVVSALPNYDDDFNDACSAGYYLSPDETSITIQRFRYKITGLSTARTCFLNWWEVEYDENGGVVNAVPKGYILIPGVTETPVYTVNEPDTPNHTIQISWSVP